MKLSGSPFTMRGHLRRCWLFTFRTPASAARKFLPPPLELITRDDFAFWNVVVCELRSLRPAPLPAAVGIGYWHVAYRLHAQAHLESGDTIEGLYFVRSDCDRWLVARVGNMLTNFHFHLAEIKVETGDKTVEGRIRTPDANAHFRLRDEIPAALTPGSPFASVSEAAEFLEYKPCSLAPDGPDNVEIVRINRREADWKSRVVTAEINDWHFLSAQDAVPEICYALEPIDYEWSRAEIRRLAP